MAARPVHFLRIGSLLRCLSRCLASKHGITKSYIVSCQMFKLQTSSESLNRHTLYLPWELRRVLSRCLGRPNSPNCELKSKWYVWEDFHLVWSVIKSSEHLHWSFDLILISFPPRIWLWTMLHLQGYHASRHVPTHPTESAGRTGMQCPASMTNESKQKGELWDGHTSSAHRLQHTKWCGVLRNW